MAVGISQIKEITHCSERGDFSRAFLLTCQNDCDVCMGWLYFKGVDGGAVILEVGSMFKILTTRIGNDGFQ